MYCSRIVNQIILLTELLKLLTLEFQVIVKGILLRKQMQEQSDSCLQSSFHEN